MATMNEALLDASIRHQVKVLRFTKGEVARALKLLERSDREILAKLQGDVTAWNETFLRKQLTEVRRLRTQVAAELKAQVEEQAEEFALNEAQWEIEAIQSTSPVVLSLGGVAPQVLKTVAGSPINGVPLSGWLGQMVAADVTKIEQALRLGILQGETQQQIVKRVKDVADVTRANASTVVRTAYNHVSNASKQEVWNQNADILDGLRWTAMLDGRTSPVCRSRDGQVYPVDKGPRPPGHPNCRSQMTPVVKGERIVGERPMVRDVRTRKEREKDFRAEARDASGAAWKGMSAAQRDAAVKARRNAWTAENVGTVPNTTTYDGWLRRQPKAFQDEVLGPTRGKMFRDGATLDKFVDESGKQYTLAELKAETAGDALNVLQPGVGLKAKALLQQGLTGDEVLAAIKDEFPDASTTAASIASYKSELKKAGLLDPLSMTTDLIKPTALKTNQAVSDLVSQFEDGLQPGVKQALAGQWLSLADELEGGAPGAYAHYKAGKGVVASYKKLGGVSPAQAKQILAHELGHLLHKQHGVELSPADLAALDEAKKQLSDLDRKNFGYYLAHPDELIAEIYAQALSPSPYTSQGLLAETFNSVFKPQIAAARAAMDAKFPKPSQFKPVPGGAPTMPFEVAGKHTGIGSLAKALLQQGMPDDQVLLAVKAQFPDAKTGLASIKFYKTQLKDAGKLASGKPGPVVIGKNPAPVQPSVPTAAPEVAVLKAAETSTGSPALDAILKFASSPATTAKSAGYVKEQGIALMKAGLLDNGQLVDLLKELYPFNVISPSSVSTWKSAWKKADPRGYDKAAKLNVKWVKKAEKTGPTKLPKLHGQKLGPNASVVLNEIKKVLQDFPDTPPDSAKFFKFAVQKFGVGTTAEGVQDLVELAHYEIATGKAAVKPYMNAAASYVPPPIAKVDMTPLRLASTPSEAFPPPPRFSALQRAAGLKEFGVQANPTLAAKLNSKYNLVGDAAVTAEEAAAIKAYTGGIYHDLNRPLRQGLYSSRAALQAYVDAAQHGLSKLPKFVGLSSRGVNLTADQLRNALATYRAGEVVEETTFVSSSTGDKAAFSGNLFFRITGKRGVDVSSFSHHPGEREVLFAPGTKFRIDRVEQVKGKWIVYATEVP